MEKKKARKRPIDLNAILDDSLQFARWDSDTDPGDSESAVPNCPQKKPKVQSGSEEDGWGTWLSVSSNKEIRTNSLEIKTNGTSSHNMKDNNESGLSHDTGSPDTVILSDHEIEGAEEENGTLSRSSTTGWDVEQRISDTENGSAPFPSASSLAEFSKTPSICRDADLVKTIVPDADLPAVQDYLTQHRAHPDRLNMAVAAVLDTASAAGPESSQDHMLNMTSKTRQEHVAGASNGHQNRAGAADGDRDQTEGDQHTNGKSKASGSKEKKKDRSHTGDSQEAGCSHHSDTRPHGERQRDAGKGDGREVSVNGASEGQQAQQSADGHDLYKDVKNVIISVKKTNPHAAVNATEVCFLLGQNSGRRDRVEAVCQALLEKYGAGPASEQPRYVTGSVTDQSNNSACMAANQPLSSSDDIFNQAIKLNAEFPHTDPSEIYELLEKAENRENAVQTVREKLKQLRTGSDPGRPGKDNAETKPAMPLDDSMSTDPLVRDDPVFRDMRIISRMFPERDRNEVYAMVEAHYYKPDRVQVVIEELLSMERNSQDNSLPPPQSPALPVHEEEQRETTSGMAAGLATPNQDGVMENLLQAEVEHLRDIFPDCDPNYIYERLEAHKASADRIKVIASEMFERKDYPRLKEVQEKQTRAAQKRRLQNMLFTMEEFLAKFPDPEAAFNGPQEREVTDSYRNHLDTLLCHDFPEFRQSYVTKVVESHRHRLMPTLRELEASRAAILASGGRSKKLRQVPKEVPLSYPEEPDEYFFYELWFSLNEARVKNHFESKKAERQARVERARAQNELYECQCCFEDECLFEDMNTCGDGHLFCRQCIARSAEAAFGEGKTTFPCLSGTCEHPIPLSVLKEVLPSAMFSKVLRKMQEEEVRQAGIADLVECPFCSFATIMSDPEDRVFRCLNPQCLKDSCRLCREPNHIPLRCEEVERQSETDMRTFIEKRVTEAMLRKCHRCGKRFVKDVGCNKMTCICGATSCYVCREPDIDYNHFNGNKCNEGDMNRLHAKEMEKAAKDAREEYLALHPEAADIELKHDPAQHLKNIQPGGPGQGSKRRRGRRGRRR